MRHAQEELEEIPSHNIGNQEILRLTDQGRYTTQRGTHSTVHHQAAQERAELFQVLTMQLNHGIVRRRVMVVIELLARCHLVIDAEETRGHRDDDRCHGQRIQGTPTEQPL